MLHKRGAFAIAHVVVPFPAVTNSISPPSVFLHPFNRVEAMETSQPLSIESFSYSWLLNLEPSLDSLDSSFSASIDHASCDESSFIEMDPRMPPSKRFFRNSQDFKFDFPNLQTPVTLVHADELFANGYILPFSVNPSKMEAFEVSADSTSTLPSSSHAPNLVVVPASKTIRLRRCRRLSKRMFFKYLDFLRPLYRRIRGCKSSRRAAESATSPRISVAYSADEGRKSCDSSESSIYEAVLHCKKSIGK